MSPTTRLGSDQFAVRGVRSPIVGRSHELTVLSEVLERAITYGAPQLCTVVGNQGVGKSRLTAEWSNKLSQQHPNVRLYHGRASEKGPAYVAIARLLRDRFGMDEGQDEAHSSHERFRSECSRVFGDRRVGEVLHFLGSYLGLRFADSPFVSVFEHDPAQHDQIARTVLRRFLELDAGQSPVVLVLDDVQWADDQTLDLLGELANALAGSPVMLVVCARPDLFARAPNWGSGQVDHTRLELRNLAIDDAETLLRNLLARADEIPAELIEDAVELTGGNPFFLEELVRVMIANGTIDVSLSRWRIDVERALETELPISVEEAIEARISALAPPERDLLAKACVLGNVFWTGAMVVLTRQEDTSARVVFGRDEVREEVGRMLEDLVERDYLLKMPDSSIPGEEEFVFKHNLERELIAKAVDPGRLKRHNLLCAQWFEAKPGERHEEQLEFLAQLYERAGARRRAAMTWIAAGDKARGRFANEAAAEYYGKGIALLDPEDQLAKLDATHNLGDVEALMGHYEAALRHFSDMLRMAWLLDHRAKGAAAHGRIGRLYRSQGDYGKATDHLKLSYQMFTREGDRRGVAAALDDIAKVEALKGVYADALEHARHALAIRRALGEPRSIAVSLANLAGICQSTGAFEQAMEAFEEALAIRREIDDRPGVAQSELTVGVVMRERGDLRAAHRHLDTALAIAKEIGDRALEVQAQAQLGATAAQQGDGIGAQQQLNRAGELAKQLGNQVAMAEVARLTAEALLLGGDAVTAPDYAREALELVKKAGLNVAEGILYRTMGEIAAAGGLGPTEAAQAGGEFERSIEILAALKNDLELARSLASYSKWRESVGQGAESDRLAARAQEIFARLREASAASTPATTSGVATLSDRKVNARG